MPDTWKELPFLEGALQCIRTERTLTAHEHDTRHVTPDTRQYDHTARRAGRASSHQSLWGRDFKERIINLTAPITQLISPTTLPNTPKPANARRACSILKQIPDIIVFRTRGLLKGCVAHHGPPRLDAECARGKAWIGTAVLGSASFQRISRPQLKNEDSCTRSKGC